MKSLRVIIERVSTSIVMVASIAIVVSLPWLSVQAAEDANTHMDSSTRTIQSSSADTLGLPLSLSQAYELTSNHAPRVSEFELQALIADLKKANSSAILLPSISLQGSAAYNSEVASIPINIPGEVAPSISNDQYKVALRLEQILYDGGVVKRLKILEDASLAYVNQEVAVSQYALRQLVEVAYFGVLMRRQALRSIETRRQDVQSKLDEVHALVDEGVLTASNADQLSAELIRIKQQRITTKSEERASLNVLSELLGQDLLPDTPLIIPESSMDTGTMTNAVTVAARPELRQFELAKQLISSRESIGSRKNKPTVASFGEVAYGRAPGLNLFENDFKPFFSVGLRFNWGFWDWKTQQRSTQISSLEQDLVDVKQSEFERNITLSLVRKNQDILRLKELIATDDEIIELRIRITADADGRLDNGLITASDFVNELNAETQARLAKNLHHLELALARAQYHTIRGGDR